MRNFFATIILIFLGLGLVCGAVGCQSTKSSKTKGKALLLQLAVFALVFLAAPLPFPAQ